MGQDIFCSSNIGMAMEAAYFNVPVVCVGMEKRLGGHSAEECMPAVKFVEKNIEKLGGLKLPKHTFLNINVPTVADYKELKGVIVARLGWLDLINAFEEKVDHKGQKYYWAKYVAREGKADEGTALHAYKNGFVAITPINYDPTSYMELSRYEKIVGRGEHISPTNSRR